MRQHRQRGRNYDLPLPPDELTKNDIDNLIKDHPFDFENPIHITHLFPSDDEDHSHDQ